MQLTIAAAIAATLVLFGCAKTATISDFRDVRNSPFEFIDARLAQDKQSEFLALSPNSCDYAIRRLGDEVSRPSKMDILHRDLVDGLGNQLTGKTIRVTRYAIYFNAHASYASAARNFYGSSGGAVGALAGGAVAPNECTKDKVSGGWYEPSELTSMNSPTVVELEIEVGGKAFIARAVYSEREFSNGTFSSAQDTTVILDAIRLAHAKLVNDLRMMTP
jgi:hypothetical protein